MKEILILAHDIGLTVRFKPITTTEYDQWVSEGGGRVISSRLWRQSLRRLTYKQLQILCPTKVSTSKP